MSVSHPERGRGRSTSHSQSKRVLMVVENCPYRRDPRVRKETKALLAAGYQVSVIAPALAGQPWREWVDGASLYQFPISFIGESGGGYLLEYAYAMLAIAALSLMVLFAEGFDVIHVANPPDCIVLAVCFHKLWGKRIIYDQHDLSPELYFVKFRHPNRWISRMLLWLESVSYRMANHVIVTNESYRQIAIQRGRLMPQNVTVVRNGPEMPGLTAIETLPAVRARAETIIAFAGIIGSQDGVDCLLRALRVLRYELGRENFHCMVLGDGDALASVKALANELRLNESVTFTGWIADAQLYARYLASADICVAPEPSNDYNDRSTLVKVTEYMSAGKPIVAFDLPETRFSAQAAAVLAGPNDEREFASRIALLMDNPSLRASVGELGLRRIQTKLAWQYSVPNLLHAYSRIFELPTPPLVHSDLAPVADEKEQAAHAGSSR